MPGREVNAVVFDIGGVLLDWDPRHLYRQLFDDPARMSDFLTLVCTSDWHRAHDLGADTTQSCQELARRHPSLAEEIMAWDRRGEEMIAGEIGGTVRVLAELTAARVRCFALSNMEADRYLIRRDRFEWLRWFEGSVISGIEGVAKPDPRIYQILLGRYGLDPGTTLFIDDRAENVEAARQTGLQGLRFVSAGELRTRLRARGLPVAVTAPGD